MEAVKDRVHLVVGQAVVHTRKRCSSLSEILKAFGTVVTMPAFV